LNIGAATQRIPALASSSSIDQPRWRIVASSARKASGSVIVAGVKRARDLLRRKGAIRSADISASRALPIPEAWLARRWPMPKKARIGS